LKNRSLVLLSGEQGSLPEAEARSVFLTYDDGSRFEVPEKRVLLCESEADPFRVGARMAYARRTGLVIEDSAEAASFFKGHKKVRFEHFDLFPRLPPPDPEEYLGGLQAEVDLEDPDFEVTLIRGKNEYLALTDPGGMSQAWSTRRPRKRPFFHPSAIFPKFSRALVNLSRCREGDVFLEPFAGTGSIAIEASIVGAKVIALDLMDKMVKGASANMTHFGQDWLGVVRGDATRLPLRQVDAVATDLPYGRVSSTRGKTTGEILKSLVPELARGMDSGSTAVLMHPDTLKVKGGDGFRVVEEHDLHVHKLLTRTITVLRRE